MKNIRSQQRFSLAAVTFVALLVASGFVSCSKSELELTPDRSGAINLSANVQATTNTRAAVGGTTFPANTTNVFGLTAYAGKEAATAPIANWSVPYINNISVNSDASSILTFATAQYYPANGDKVYFYGYAPAATKLTPGSASAAPIANYTIDGQMDIMAAQDIRGIAKATSGGTQLQPALAFTHKLMQLKFKVVKDASYKAGQKVTKISVKNVKTSAKLNIITGNLIFDGTPTGNLLLPIKEGINDEITSLGTAMDGCVMLEPAGANAKITLNVTVGGVTYDDISVTLSGTNVGMAGTICLITLTFKSDEIIEATVTPWNDSETSDKIGELCIGDCLYGGIVYAVDGSGAKIFSLDQGSGLKWSNQNTDVVDAMGDTDGKVNVTAMKAYSIANTNNVDLTKRTTGVFATDFPAAHFCDKKKTGGVTGWYLPAKEELNALRAAYEANKTAIDAVLTNNSGTAFASGYFWSSTYNSGNTAWSVRLDGSEDGSGKVTSSNYVRCVRGL